MNLPTNPLASVCPRFYRFALAVVALATVGHAACAQSDGDFRDELPRIPARSPQESLQALHVVSGFHAELVAAEPLVVDPIAIAFDADGNLFAVEMRDYSEDSQLNLGRIRRLVDENGDGIFDSSQVFAENLSWPTAVTCYDGGIVVAVPPDLIYLKDHDGDGRADERHTLYHGFGRSNVQGMVNTLKWGLDNHIHGATSSTGASLENAENSAAAKIELRGRDFRMSPRKWQLEPTSGGGQHGLSFNRWGEKFVCSNSDHIQQILYDDNILSRNPLASPLPARVSIAADGPQADVFRASPVEPWRVVRTRLRVSGQVPGPVEGGGRAAGYFTGATGITIYRGNAWPREYLDTAFVCDVGSNLIHRKRLSDNGLQYRAERIDAGTEFAASEDIWFRPVQLANAPDGNLYVVDMCREVIEHPASLPPEIKQHLDLTSGRNRGRIFRIVHDGFQATPLRALSQQSTAECVALLDHPNGWHRETAARLLYERSDPAAVPLLRQLIANDPTAEGYLTALYALDSQQELTSTDLLAALTHSHSQVRRHAIRLSEAIAPTSPPLVAALLAMTNDTDAKVRFQLAQSLGVLPGSDERDAALLRLVAQGQDTGYLAMAAQLALPETPLAFLATLGAAPALTNSHEGNILLTRLVDQLRKQASNVDANQLGQWFERTYAATPAVLLRLLPSLLIPADNPLSQRLHASSAGGRVDELWQTAREMATNDQVSEEIRSQALRALATDPSDKAQEILAATVAPIYSIPLQLAAIDAICLAGPPKTFAASIADWQQHSPTIRVRLIDAMLTRREWQNALFDALHQRRIALSDMAPVQRQQLERAIDKSRWAELENELHVAHAPDIEQRLRLYRERLSAGGGNVDRGREVFRKSCMTCHRLENVGHEVGPNLAAMQNRGAEAILLNVLEPNREVNPQYLAYTAITQDGRILNGMIRQETGTSVELIGPDNQASVLLRTELESLTSTGQSLMPTGLDQQITPDDMTSLIQYLLSLRP